MAILKEFFLKNTTGNVLALTILLLIAGVRRHAFGFDLGLACERLLFSLTLPTLILTRYLFADPFPQQRETILGLLLGSEETYILFSYFQWIMIGWFASSIGKRFDKIPLA